MAIKQLIESGVVRTFKGGVVDASTDTSLPLIVINPKRLEVKITTPEPVKLIIAYTESSQAVVDIEVGPSASLSIVELYLADSYSKVNVNQAAGSICKSMTAILSSSNVSYNFSMLGEHAENIYSGVFIASGNQHATIDLTTRHMVSNCTSNSLIKGVSANKATGEFRGLVYVAPDAQKTDAQQQSRNIELDQSHIISLPQLEIYADDVRCSHGSTVGYADADALFYMRQRGLSENSARRLQIEGFINDIVSKCDIEHICCILQSAVTEKLANI